MTRLSSLDRRFCLVFSLPLLWLAVAATPAAGQTAGVPGQDIIFLLQPHPEGACQSAGHTQDVDCFETLAELNTAIWHPVTGINPTQASPLIVEIGPGEFPATKNAELLCPLGGGYVTFRGAGRENTRLAHRVGNAGHTAVLMAAVGCEGLAFQDLAMIADDPIADLSYPILWSGAGSSSWTHVDLIGDRAGWYDANCFGSASDDPAGEHYFFGSRFISGVWGFYAECGDSWLYGSEVLVKPSEFGGASEAAIIGVWARQRSSVHLFGSTVRVTTKGITSGITTARGVLVGPGHGEYHHHGGIINVGVGNLPGATAIGVDSDNAGGTGDSRAHTLDTAFVVDGGAATIRTQGEVVHSPLLWQSGTAPPVANLVSISGQDLYVETDCNSVGDCDSGGAAPPYDESHLMVYDDRCGADPWFDIVTKRCRNDIVDPVAGALAALDGRVTTLEAQP